MHSQSQRERLQAFLKEHCADSELLIKSLFVAGARFANWRWQTLHEFFVSLIRMQEAVRVVARNPDGSPLFSSRDGDAHRLIGMVTGTAFWDQTRALAAVVSQLT